MERGHRGIVEILLRLEQEAVPPILDEWNGDNASEGMTVQQTLLGLPALQRRMLTGFFGGLETADLILSNGDDFPDTWVARSGALDDTQAMSFPNHTGAAQTYYIYVDVVSSFDTRVYDLDVSTFPELFAEIPVRPVRFST